MDYKTLKASLSFPAVLEHYGVKMRGKDQLQGFCPLPAHGEQPGKSKSPSFSVNAAKNVFHCFGCGAKGNIIEFAALMEGWDPKEKASFRKAAVMLSEKFKDAKAERRELPPPTGPNKPLRFELNLVDHPYLHERGFAPETIGHFGLGYCRGGMMKGRIAIPLHNTDGELIGYAGRAVDERTPKYRFPKSLHKGQFLYNANRLRRDLGLLLIVEGFPSVWWATQCDFPNVVAVMGSSMSKEQGEIVLSLTRPEAKIYVMPDGDSAGAHLAESVFQAIGPHRFLRWIKLKKGEQPTSFSHDKFISLFTAP